ncbi:MAG TPA: hypothetical protein VK427_13980 [Kofleriaceae bacterium]|nr:hypothetical protein [Kofleriaceae bacterium]
MRKLTSLVFVVGCAGSNVQTVEPAQQSPRPDPAQGGFQAREPVVEGWVDLGTPVTISPVERRIELAGRAGKIAQLMFKGVSGEPEIAQVRIVYMDKTERTVELNKRFLPGDGQVVELKEDRPIQTISIFLDPDSQGTFTVFGA